MIGHLVSSGIGESDCELIGDGTFAQPVNTWTSFAYAVLGVWVALRYGRSGDAIGAMSLGFAGILVLIGAGSVMFHGPQGAGAQWLHDVPIVLALALIVFWNLATVGRVSWVRAAQFAALTAVVIGIAALVVPSAALWAGIPVGIAGVITEWMARRGARSWAPVVAVLAIGAVLNVLGRTSGPLCDPDSVIQLHGVWHVLTALAFVLWARSASTTTRRHESADQSEVSA